MDDHEARDRVARIEGLLEQVESLSDPVARDTATETVQALLELYGEGLDRIVGHVAERDSNGLAEAFASDELVSHILLLHGLHPVPLEDRVRGALSEVRPYLESHGGNVELVGIDDGVVRLRLEGSCSGCPSSAMTLKLAIEDAIHKAAPDVEDIDAEGVTAEESPLLSLTVSEAVAKGTPLPQADGGQADADAWATAGALPELTGGGTIVKDVAGEEILFLRLDATFYAYRPACPGCEESLAGAALNLAVLECLACGHRYDAIRAGRCLDEPRLYLEPVPLLTTDAGLVKVAVRSAVS